MEYARLSDDGGSHRCIWLFAVQISVSKPAALAAKVSPIEASRDLWDGRDDKEECKA